MKSRITKVLFGFLGVFTAIALLFRHKAIAQVVSEYLIVTVVLFFFCICGDCRTREVVCRPSCTESTACNGSNGCGGICTNNCAQCTPTPIVPTPVGATPTPIQTGPYGTYVGTTSTSTSQTSPYQQSSPYIIECLPPPLPTLYPTVQINGSLKIDESATHNRCNVDFQYTGSIPVRPGLVVSPGSSHSSGVTYNCDEIKNGDTTYSCTVTVNNRIDPSVNPIQNVQLDVPRVEGLQYRIHWIGPCTTNNCMPSTDCSDSNMYLTFDVSKPNPYFDRNIVLSSDDGWFKLKNASFNNVSQRDNIFPLEVQKFDNDDEAIGMFIVGEGGLVTTNPTFGLVNTTAYSTNNWFSSGYDLKHFFANSGSNVDAYIRYLKDKVNNDEVIDVTSDLGLIERSTTKKLFKYDGNLTIDSNTNLSLIDKKSLVLIVDGNVDFNVTSGIFNPTNSITIIAKTIKFYDKNTVTTPYTNWTGVVKSAKGIFIADMIDLGQSMDIPIKVTGNLISLGSGAIENNRKNIDYRKPSIFVVFDPKIYIDTISAIGLKTFNWEQN